MAHWKKALVIANGPLPSRRRIAGWLDEETLIVCADGGANRARARALIPHLVIGDLDSITPGTAAALAGVETIRVEDQENTDLEKVLDYLLAHGITAAVVLGATGRRPDHTLANFSILAKYHSRLDLLFVDSWCRMEIIDRPVQLDLAPGTTLSMLPLGRCEGVTTHGLAYPLVHQVLEPGVRESISNRVSKSPVEISLTVGKLLLFIVDKK
ncbi:MAG TPA: thiamine diphosphokinase [bacterium]|nr:thiamine diphosphokinase [bacterium]